MNRNLYLIAFYATFLISCGYSCECDELQCEQELFFELRPETWGYTPNDLDTILSIYQLEGESSKDTLYTYLKNDSFYSTANCYIPWYFYLPRKQTNKVDGKYKSVSFYHTYIGQDTITIDEIKRSAKHADNLKCRCELYYVFEFNLDHVPLKFTSTDQPIRLKRK